ATAPARLPTLLSPLNHPRRRRKGRRRARRRRGRGSQGRRAPHVWCRWCASAEGGMRVKSVSSPAHTTLPSRASYPAGPSMRASLPGAVPSGQLPAVQKPFEETVLLWHHDPCDRVWPMERCHGGGESQDGFLHGALPQSSRPLPQANAVPQEGGLWECALVHLCVRALVLVCECLCSHMCVETSHPDPCPKPIHCRKKVGCACVHLCICVCAHLCLCVSASVHTCVETSHPDPCPKPTQCRMKLPSQANAMPQEGGLCVSVLALHVTVRCACLRLKKEWLCSQVQTGTAKAAANGASNPTTGPLFYAAPPLPSLPVTVRCACLRLKKEWLCSQVQSATAKAAANGASNPSSSIDCSTNASSSGGGGGGGRLRESMVGVGLIPCDDECRRIQEEERKRREAEEKREAERKAAAAAEAERLRLEAEAAVSVYNLVLCV
ncbi:unnamed protein product, partial [Closterium sp. NIES-65]